MPMQRPYAQNKKKATPKTFVLLGAFVLIAVMLAVLLTGIANDKKEQNRYLKGVYINGIDMSQYTREQGESSFNAWADRLVNTEYTLTYLDRSWTFSPARDVDANIEMESALSQAWSLGHIGTSSEKSRTRKLIASQPQYLTADLTYSEAKLDEYIERLKADIDVAPVDAEIIVTETEPRIIGDSCDGIELKSSDAYDLLIGLLNNGSDQAKIELPISVTEPKITNDKDEGGLQVIAEWTTDMTISSWTRRGNVRLALNCFNGMAVQPNEIISFNDIVGERTETKGYVEATVYSGATTSTGIGGGVCQASSTLYGAIMKAGLEYIERNHHAMIVSYTGASCDAAVDWDAKQDFKFINNTDGTIYLFTHVDGQEARVTVYGKLPEYRIELESKIIQEGIVNENIVYIDDKDAQYCYFTDETRLYKEGKKGRISELYRVYYDRVTGDEVKRELVSGDTYAGEAFIYWRGTHRR